MKFREQHYHLSIELPINGEPTTITIALEEVQEWLKQLVIEPEQQTVPFYIEDNGQTFSLDLPILYVDVFKKLVRQIELKKNIIPFYLRDCLADVTRKISEKDQLTTAIGREPEIEKAWFYLSQKTRNNVFFIGEKDVGKTFIALEIAKRIATGNCPKELFNKHVLMLVPSFLLKKSDSPTFQYKINALVEFLAQNKNDIILYVEDAVYMKVDIQLIYILYSCLKRYSIPFITTTSTDNFEDYIYNDQSISKYVNYIHVDEPELNELLPMVQPTIECLTKQYGISISEKMAQYAIFTSDLNTSVSSNPGKVINILERAFLYAKRKNKSEVDKQCILSCSDSKFKEYARMPEAEKKATAYHEVGHYIMAVKSKYRKNIKVSCVSTLPTDWWAGVTMSYYDIEEYAVSSKDYCIDYIAMLLAGRYSEQKFTNLYSTGATSDLEQANIIAKRMIMDWGFSTNPLNYNRQYNYSDYLLMSEAKKEQIDNEIQSFIDEGKQRALQVLEENAGLIEVIVQKLLVDEILSGDELEAICKEFEQNK